MATEDNTSYINHATVNDINSGMIEYRNRELKNVFDNLSKKRQELFHYNPVTNTVDFDGFEVDIPSLTVKVGDVIAVKETSKSSAKFKALVEANKVAPNWLDVNLEEMSAKVVGLPTREDIDIEIAEHLIIELYSK